jgi:AraC family transcriptional regulator
MVQPQLLSEFSMQTIQSMPRNTLQLTSAELWGGIKLEHHLLPPLEVQDIVTTAYTVSVQLSNPITIESSNGDRLQTMQFVPDDVCIFPVQLPLSARWRQPLEVIVVALEPEFMAQSISDEETVNPTDVLLQLGSKDPFIKAICLALHQELQQGCPGGRLYGETVGMALAVHLLTHYSTANLRWQDYRIVQNHELSSRRLSQIVDYIQSHLDEDMSLRTLAALLDMSPHYFCHLFKRVMGLPPHQYVIQQRVERARLLLKRRDRTIADIALECGFGNQSHLTKQFKKLYGITPKKYRDEIQQFLSSAELGG